MLLRLSAAAKQLATNAQRLLTLAESGCIHIEGAAAAEAQAIVALDGLRAGLAAHHAIDKGAPQPTISLPADVLNEPTLDLVSQFAGGTAGLGIEQTLTLVLQMGLNAAQEEIARHPIRFTLRAQDLAAKTEHAA